MQKKIAFTYQHFKEIKSLLKPEQYEGYEAFFDKALERILKKNNPPPKDL